MRILLDENESAHDSGDNHQPSPVRNGYQTPEQANPWFLLITNLTNQNNRLQIQNTKLFEENFNLKNTIGELNEKIAILEQSKKKICVEERSMQTGDFGRLPITDILTQSYPSAELGNIINGTIDRMGLVVGECENESERKTKTTESKKNRNAVVKQTLYACGRQ